MGHVCNCGSSFFNCMILFTPTMKVIRCDPNTGKKLSEIVMPVKQTTSCCFAGPNLDQLIVTSARFVFLSD